MLRDVYICTVMRIPYASPPTGKLRFMPPVTAAHWSNIKNAHSAAPVCPQTLPDIKNETFALQRMTYGRLSVLKRMLPMLQNQSEDCLYLNIYTPVALVFEIRIFSAISKQS
ncbi:uncharacterized protein B4U80_03045 [Leptotrombidium deliense]|uniref:Carboxylesterase type B domain-containing protein n=1 Tax=Leptotrombidium deliense TaxID=299467 RepID=A0A443SRL7_9ACAR|nr:uncharacterized protein B4U80_03045 [Leptotrombidium deliense]